MMRRIPVLVVAATVLVVGGCSETYDAGIEETTTTPPTTTTSTTTTTTTIQPTTTTDIATTSSIATSTTEAIGELFEVVYDGSGCTSNGPSEVEAGEHSFLLVDPSGDIGTVYIIRLDEGRTLQEAVDAQPAPGKWYPKPDWHHYTGDLGSSESDEGVIFRKLLRTPGPHLVLASRYYGIPEDERIHWMCTPSFTVVESTE